MKSTRLVVGLILLILVCFVVSDGVVTVVAQEIQRALVINLKTPHPIVGEVDVEGPIPHSDMARFTDVVTTPAAPLETSLWVDTGTLDLSGFTHIVVSIHGTLKGTIQQDGQIGVMLVPDEERILQALAEGELHLPLQAAAEVVSGQAIYFSGSEAPQPVAFPRYRVFAFNTTDRSASVDIFIYMTN